MQYLVVHTSSVVPISRSYLYIYMCPYCFFYVTTLPRYLERERERGREREREEEREGEVEGERERERER